MIDTPLISVIMPTYNRATMIKDAVESVVKQSYRNFEFIIIDDASTDETEEIIKSFADPRIRYVQTKSNHGEYWSTNYAANMANGKYLTWIHSDDRMPTNSLEVRYGALEKNQGIDFVHGDIERIDENNNIIEKLNAVEWPKEKLLEQYLLLEEEREIKYMIHHLSIMMRWNFFYKAGPFDASLPFAGDIDWLIRAIRCGQFMRIPQVLYYYRTHPGSRRVQDVKGGVDKKTVTLMINRRYTE